ncbi:hypothetical protein D3C86_2030380 [compost metagenome]
MDADEEILECFDPRHEGDLSKTLKLEYGEVSLDSPDVSGMKVYLPKRLFDRQTTLLPVGVEALEKIMFAN